VEPKSFDKYMRNLNDQYLKIASVLWQRMQTPMKTD